MSCWNCQAALPVDARFCSECGERVQADPGEGPCRVCGAPLPLDARFCGNCGSPDPLAPSDGAAPDQPDVRVVETPLPAVVPSATPAPGVAPEGPVVFDDEDDEEPDVMALLRGEDERRPTVPLGPSGTAPQPPAKPTGMGRPAPVPRTGPVGASPGSYSLRGPSLRSRDDAKAPPPPPRTGQRGKMQGASAQVRRAAPGEGAKRSPSLRSPPPSGARPPSPEASTRERARSESAAPSRRPEDSSEPPLDEPVVPMLVMSADAQPVPTPAGGVTSDSGSSLGIIDEMLPELPSGERVLAPGPLPVEGPPPRGRYPVPKPTTRPNLPPRPMGTPAPTPVIDEPPVEADADSMRSRDDFAASSDGSTGMGLIEGLDLDDDDELPPGVPRSAPTREVPSHEVLASIEPGTIELERVDDSQSPQTTMRADVVVDDDVEELDVDLEVDDDEGGPQRRTLVVDGPQPPAPYEGVGPPGSSPSGPRSSPTSVTRPELPAVGTEPSGAAPIDPRALPMSFAKAPAGDVLPDNRATLIPDAPSRDGHGHATLAPGLLDEDDEERQVTLPPGGLVIERTERPTLVPIDFEDDDEDEDGVPDPVETQPTPKPLPRPVPRLDRTMVPDDPEHPPAPAPYTGPGGEPPPSPVLTTPDREADVPAASGEFRVAGLDLSYLEDLDVMETIEHVPVTDEGTVITRQPQPPAPFGTEAAAMPLVPVRLVMIGARGEVVTEVRIDVGRHLDLGRDTPGPWSDDRRMEPLHARLFPGAGGVVVDDFGQPNGVYTKISDTIAVEDGDEFKVGQARLALQRVTGRDGRWGLLTLVRHDAGEPETHVLVRDEIFIGREDGDITFPNDTFVSGDHCRFSREGNAVYLEDLGSSNGTYVRVRAGQCVAFDGLLLVGHTQFEVHRG